MKNEEEVVTGTALLWAMHSEFVAEADSLGRTPKNQGHSMRLLVLTRYTALLEQLAKLGDALNGK